MIIKSMTRKRNIGQLIRYICKEEKEVEKKGFTMKHNITGHDKDRWIAQLKFNETLRTTKRKDQVAIYHEVMSFSIHDKEKITRSMLKDMAKQYIQLRGKDSMMLMAEHRDKAHIHVHIALSGTKFLTGKANRISKADFEKFRMNMEEYQKKKYPELKHSIAYTKDKGKSKDKKHTRQSKKQTLEELLKGIYTEANSTKDFETKLKQAGHEVYYRGGKMTGIQYEGNMKFRFAKLGYDKEQFEQLDTKEQVHNTQMQELDDLRNNAKDRDKDDWRQDRFKEDDTDNDQEEDIDYDTDDDR
jgi:Relaxase/Mobilisation nuclease domain